MIRKGDLRIEFQNLTGKKASTKKTNYLSCDAAYTSIDYKIWLEEELLEARNKLEKLNK